jgi:thiol-disulfide isomerase/thioredoxin
MTRRRMTPRLAAPSACTLAGALLLGGCAAGVGGGDTRSGTAFVSGDGAITQVPAGRRGEPVELAGRTLDGVRLDLATMRGTPVVLNVWGSWCSPCRKEAPALQSAYQQLKPQGVSFVGINTRDSIAGGQAFERAFTVGYPSLLDTGGLLLRLHGAVGPEAIPTTLVLDPQGRIAARFSGPITTRTLVQLVADVAVGG